MKFYHRFLLFSLLLCCVLAPVFAQTIAVGSIDNTLSYAPGSSIAIPITVTGGCIGTTNIYNLYLSDAAGSFATRTQIGQFVGFYATFVNGVIPTTTVPGAGYRVLVESTSPVRTSASVGINIIAGTAVTAGINSPNSPPLNATYPDVLGSGCQSTATTFAYNNTGSTPGSVITANIHDEFTPNATPDANVVVNTTNSSTNIKTTNYTIFVKAINGGVAGTRAYMLVNNIINTNFGTSGSNAVCQGGFLTFTVDISSPTGIQHNYPGNLYTVSWGDQSKEDFTFCNLSSGSIIHRYLSSSCGTTGGLQNNSFDVALNITNSYCNAKLGSVIAPVKVSAPPTNVITSNANACAGVVIFNNSSYPGENPNSPAGACQDYAGALYTWMLDGVRQTGYEFVPKSTQFSPTLAPGQHHLELVLENNPTSCPVSNAVFDVCVQEAPKPQFSLASTTICLGTTVTPTDLSVLDQNCNAVNTYAWTVTGGPFTYAGSTNSASKQPQFVFSAIGTYQIKLGITTPNCGLIETVIQEVVVDNPPTAALWANVALCGPQVLNFNTNPGPTQTTFSGSPVTLPDTYTWSVTGGPFTFSNGTTINSQYPQITLTDPGVYTVSVTHKNSCGTKTSSQQITIQQAPKISAGPDAAICPVNTYQLTGTISDMTNVVLPVTWTKTGGDGIINNPNTLTPTYTLGPNDKANGGNIQFTLNVTTTLASPCNSIPISTNLKIYPTNTVTSAPGKTICSGNAVNYPVTASNPGSTFTWTATGSSPDISGFNSQATPLSNPTINDVLVSTDPNNTLTVTYTITPYSNGCTGTPFTYTVTVTPKPVIAPIADVPLCSGTATNIALNAIPTGTKFIWTVAAPAGITGYSNQAVGITGPIVQTLTNSTTAAITVIYTITPISPAGCPGTPVNVNVTVQPPTTIANAGPNTPICNLTTFTLAGNTPIVGTGKWTEQNNLPVIFVNNTDPNTVVNGLVPGTTYHFVWTITSGCGAPSANTVTITDNTLSVGGTVSAPNDPVCYGSSDVLTLSGQNGSVLRWERSIDGGTTWVVIGGTNTNPTYNYINLTQTTAFRAVVMNGNCTFANSQPLTITVNAPTVIADAGVPQTLCNQSNVKLTGNDPQGLTGTWTQVAGPAAFIVAPNNFNTDVTGLTGGNIYKFRWTIQGLTSCPNTFSDVTITNQGTIINTVNIAGNTTTEVCAGATVNLTGTTPTGGNNSTYSYLWESSTDNGITWVALSSSNGQTPNAQSTVARIAGTVVFRRTVFSGPCNSVSNQLTVNTQSSLGNNSIASVTTETCNNIVPATPIIGSIPTGGDGLYFYKWQISTDNITFADIAGASNKDYQPPALTVTSYYRRVVSTTLCSGSLDITSNVVSIKVNADVVAKFNATMQTNCAPFNITSQIITAIADPNAQGYTWYANGTLIGSGLAFPGYLIPTDGVTVNIMLRVSSKFGCKDDTYSLNFTSVKQITAGFTMDKNTGCGPLTVSFTNTSTPMVNGTVYTWSFDDGTSYTGVTPPPHTFQPSADGKDITYRVTLSPTGCSPQPFILPVTVYPATPVTTIDPGTLTGCSPYIITALNTSPGTNISYDYYLLNENNVQVQLIHKTDKSDAVFNPITVTTTKIYTLYMVATNLCGKTGTSIKYPISISASGVVSLMDITPKDNLFKAAGCAPFSAVFHNLSTGGNSYVYNIYDANFSYIKSIINTTTSDQPYIFDTPGTYYVSLITLSACSPNTGPESPKVRVDVYPVAAPAFVADITSGCTQLTAKFTNNTPAIGSSPATSFTYDWDFGDGTPHSTQFAPTHTYNYNASPYNITLTVTNNNGCTATTTRANYITVFTPPLTDFTAKPDTITSIPNYHFDLLDKSKGTPTVWQWDLGDGTLSGKQNPSHTYADTGSYTVKLTTYTANGCTDSKTHILRVTGVPGQLFIPNAFMPTSLSDELRVFTVKGSGIKEWALRIFNNWGQLVFETTKLSSKGEPVEFWDGTYKGQQAQQGVYAWEVSATFINGTTWKGMTYKSGAPKRAGTLNLIR